VNSLRLRPNRFIFASFRTICEGLKGQVTKHCIQMVNWRGQGFTKLDNSQRQSVLQLIQIDLLSVLSNRDDDVERNGQSTAAIFESHHRPRTLLHRLQK
jgi:hypothetical protein